MTETLKQTLDRLEKEIVKLKSDVELSKNRNLNKPARTPDYVAELNTRIDKLNKRTTPVIDIKKEIEKTVTIDYINNIYRNK